MSATRVRRPPDRARQLILEAAERLLIEGGPQAVQVRAVAQRVGMTDAGVAHHFGSRDGLLAALLRQGGRRLRAAVEEAIAAWVGGRVSVAGLVDAMAAVYDDGYGALAVALHAAGWRDEGAGMLAPAVDALHAARPTTGKTPRSRAETRVAVAALHQGLALDPVYGEAFARSAGTRAAGTRRRRETRRWWVQTIETMLEIEPG